MGAGFSNGWAPRMTTSPGSENWIRGKQFAERLLAVVQPDFNAAPWEAFHRFGVDGVPAGRVAEDPGLAQNGVVLGKSRIIERLMEESSDFFW